MDQLPENDEPTGSGALAVIVDSIGTFLGKVPASLQKNVGKAFSHLLRIPGAYSDGRAEEIKAYSEARVKIIKATGTKLAQVIEIDSSLAQIATQTHASKILRQQKNAIGVLKYAAQEIDGVPHQDRVEPTLCTEQQQFEPKEISEDWLNAFESEAVNMSSEQMQKLFGKMLAGEIRKPSSYSIRTVKLMGQMDSDIARLFVRFCSMSFSYGSIGGITIDSRVLTLGNKTNRGMHELGIHWLDVDALAEYGLAIDNQPFSVPYTNVINGYQGKYKPTTLRYCGKLYKFAPIAPKTASDFEDYAEYGIGLSRVGRELLSIVEFEENKAYTEALRSYLRKRGLELLEMHGR